MHIYITKTVSSAAKGELRARWHLPLGVLLAALPHTAPATEAEATHIFVSRSAEVSPLLLQASATDGGEEPDPNLITLPIDPQAGWVDSVRRLALEASLTDNRADQSCADALDFSHAYREAEFGALDWSQALEEATRGFPCTQAPLDPQRLLDWYTILGNQGAAPLDGQPWYARARALTERAAAATTLRPRSLAKGVNLDGVDVPALIRVEVSIPQPYVLLVDGLPLPEGSAALTRGAHFVQLEGPTAPGAELTLLASEVVEVTTDGQPLPSTIARAPTGEDLLAELIALTLSRETQPPPELLPAIAAHLKTQGFTWLAVVHEGEAGARVAVIRDDATWSVEEPVPPTRAGEAPAWVKVTGIGAVAVGVGASAVGITYGLQWTRLSTWQPGEEALLPGYSEHDTLEIYYQRALKTHALSIGLGVATGAAAATWAVGRGISRREPHRTAAPALGTGPGQLGLSLAWTW